MVAPTKPAASDSIRLYDRLEERVLERDQVGASSVFYDLVREGRPLSEMIREIVRIQAPYTQVPYHQRIDNGVVRFVNNDHCLLSARAALGLSRLVDPQHSLLPMAQTIWYVPTGLDPWNQLIGVMPGHYNRGRFEGAIPRPSVHWPEQEPLRLDCTLDEGLDEWLTLVQRGEVIPAYRVFLGLLERGEDRERVLAQLVFAGLIDVQDRMLYNRSYTTGHRAYRARAVVEIGDAVGWEHARPAIYTGVMDLAVGPHWYSSYEMAGEVAWIRLAEEPERQRSSIAPTPELPPERRLLANEGALSAAETEMLLYALTKAPEPAHIEAITSLLLSGARPRAIVDVCQVAAARLLLETNSALNFSMPQHCAEYMNTLGWFYDRFDHPQRIKLLYVAGSFLAQTANWLANTPGNGELYRSVPRDLRELNQTQLLVRLDQAMVARQPEESVALVNAYNAGGYDRQALVRVLALGAAKQGNDTHNQEIGLCTVEDATKNSIDPDVLLEASAQHTAGHVKYGDALEPYRRFAEAVGIQSSQHTTGDLDPREAPLDD